MAKKKCSKNQIVNPDSGRCIKIDGPTYKKLKLSEDKGKAVEKKKGSECNKDQIRNPNTNRCIKIGGPTYKKLDLKAVKKVATKAVKVASVAKVATKAVKVASVAKVATKAVKVVAKKVVKRITDMSEDVKWQSLTKDQLNDLIDNINTDMAMENNCYLNADKFKIDKKMLGSGTYATVHDACLQNDCAFVAKILKIEKSEDARRLFIHETQMQMALAELGMAPKIAMAFTCNLKNDLKYVIIMEKMDGNGLNIGHEFESDEQRKELIDLFYKFHKERFIHLDTGLRNILYKGNKLYISDFGNTLYFNDKLKFPWDLATSDLLKIFEDIGSLEYLAENLDDVVPKEYRPYLKKCFTPKNFDDCLGPGIDRMVAKYFPLNIVSKIGLYNAGTWFRFVNEYEANKLDDVLAKRMKTYK